MTDENQTPPPSKGSTWLAGGLLAVVGIAATAINWYTAETEGSYYAVMSIMGPALAGLGVCVLVAPALPPPGATPSVLHSARRYIALGAFFLGIVIGFAEFAAFNGWLPIP